MLTEQQFEELVGTYWSKMRSYAMMLLGNSTHSSTYHFAEDVVQDTFRSVWQDRAKVDMSNPELKGLLYLILRRRAADFFRRTQFPLVMDNETLDLVRHFKERTWEESFSDSVQEALNKMPTVFKDTFLLMVMMDLTHVQIAQVQKVPVGTVLSRIARARKLLRKLLQNKVVNAT